MKNFLFTCGLHHAILIEQDSFLLSKKALLAYLSVKIVNDQKRGCLWDKTASKGIYDVKERTTFKQT